MNHIERVYFRNAFRLARAAVLQDAEGFDAVLFAVERLGRLRYGRQGDLGKYKSAMSELASVSPLAETIPARWRECHVPFETLYDQMKDARNSALHEGAFARHLTSHAVNVALVLEDALMQGSDCVGDYMVREPVCACLWQPVSFIRQTLLANSFSCVPVNRGTESAPEWRLITDLAVATFLRDADSKTSREERLGTRLESCLESAKLVQPFVCAAETTVSEALAKCRGLPILIVAGVPPHLIGIATPFDLL